MGILDELTSATGDQQSNQDLIRSCLLNPAMLHTIAEGMRTGIPPAKIDCASILLEVANRRPDLAANFVGDFLEASRSNNKNLAKLGFTGLATSVTANAAEVFADRERLIDLAKQGGAMGLAATSVLAALCKNNPNYRGKLMGSLIRLVLSAEEKEVMKWLKASGPAFEGSGDSLKRLEQELAERRAGFSSELNQKISKHIVKLEKTVAKKSASK